MTLSAWRHDSEIDNRKLVDEIPYAVRLYAGLASDEQPLEVIVEQVKWLRYVALNAYDREDARTHFDYISGLEYLMGRLVSEGVAVPADLPTPPAIGKQRYDIVHPDLKPKPSK
jgi:hypothetical protein